MSADEELHKRNLIAELAYQEKAERERLALEVVEETEELTITFKDYSKASMSSRELAKFLGRDED